MYGCSYLWVTFVWQWKHEDELFYHCHTVLAMDDIIGSFEVLLKMCVVRVCVWHDCVCVYVL